MKKIILFFFTVCSLAAVAQIPVDGYITTNGSASYPTHLDSLQKGGWRIVATIAERNSITTQRRKVGMHVFVQADSTVYRLRTAVTSNDWEAVLSGGKANLSGGNTFTGDQIISGNVITNHLGIGEPDGSIRFGLDLTKNPWIQRDGEGITIGTSNQVRFNVDSAGNTFAYGNMYTLGNINVQRIGFNFLPAPTFGLGYSGSLQYKWDLPEQSGTIALIENLAGYIRKTGETGSANLSGLTSFIVPDPNGASNSQAANISYVNGVASGKANLLGGNAFTGNQSISGNLDISKRLFLPSQITAPAIPLTEGVNIFAESGSYDGFLYKTALSLNAWNGGDEYPQSARFLLPFTTRTYDLPEKSGTVALTSDIPTVNPGGETLQSVTNRASSTTNNINITGEVKVNGGNGAFIFMDRVNSGTWAWYAMDNRASLYNNSKGDTFSIDYTSGNVGIGTTSSAYKLDVAGEINATNLRINGVPVGVNTSETLQSIADRGNTTTTTLVGNKNNSEVWENAPFQAKGVNPGYSFHYPGYYGASLHMDLAGRLNWTGSALNVINGDVGIGTAQPANKLQIVGEHHNTNFNLHANNPDPTKQADLTLWASEPQLTYSGVGIGNNMINSQNPNGIIRINNSRGGSYIRLLDQGIKANVVKTDGTDISAFTVAHNGYMAIGTETATEMLTVAGNIQTKGIKVNPQSVPDYVFKPEYKLRSLTEIESFIKINSHLPEVPSEAEVKEKGLELGEMSMTLLKKVEELTLYLIEMKKENENLKAEVLEMKKEMSKK